MACVIAHLLLALNNILLFECTIAYPFICWRTSWYFQVLAIWIKLSRTFMHRCLCRQMFSNHLGGYLEAWLLDSMLNLCFVLWQIAKMPSKGTIPFCIPQAMNKNSFCSTFFQHLVLSVFWILAILISVPSNRLSIQSFLLVSFPMTPNDWLPVFFFSMSKAISYYLAECIFYFHPRQKKILYQNYAKFW